jgi:2-dehydro-3-deoxyglucarate aldolase/4-hydroxy-2-oxoheptanedioate aldolase
VTFLHSGAKMKPNAVKQKLQASGVSIGTMVIEFNTTGLPRIMAEAGAEFAIFDMEHTGWSIETVRMLMASSRSVRLLPLVRIPAVEYHFVARVLDMGAAGIMAPMVESGEQARRLVQSAKYPPAGRRGTAFGIAHDDYSGGDIVEKIQSANRETMILAQIETAAGVNHVDEIAAVEGIDVLWIGQFDLSTSLGIPGQFNHPRFQDAQAKVLDACRRHGKIPGIMGVSVADCRGVLEQGFRMVAYSGDLWIYQTALRDGVAALKGKASSE